MTHTLTYSRKHVAPTNVEEAAANRYWNPYVAGALLGLVLLATYAVTGRGLGATAAFGAVDAWLASLVAPEHAAASAALAKYFNDGSPLMSWTLFLVAGAFVGGFIAAYGAKIAKGCTSGQALTGGAILNVGSLVFMLAVFASAYALAYFVRKEWL